MNENTDSVKITEKRYAKWAALYKSGKHPCSCCMKEMVEAVDMVTQKKTGHTWKCKKCKHSVLMVGFHMKPKEEKT